MSICGFYIPQIFQKSVKYLTMRHRGHIFDIYVLMVKLYASDLMNSLNGQQINKHQNNITYESYSKKIFISYDQKRVEWVPF